MIFAAGIGSRLAPLTDHKPKALVDFQGRTMLEGVAQKLVAAGCNRLIINIHHFPDLMTEFIRNHDFGAEVVISDERELLLDTGGGILKAQDLLKAEENFILYNVDIACDINLSELVGHHNESGNLATLAVKERKSTRNLIFDKQMQLCAWRNLTTNEEKISRPYLDNEYKALAFSGISVANRNIFELITETGKFSITNLYLRLAKTEKIGGYLHSGRWADLGTIEKLSAAEELFKN